MSSMFPNRGYIFWPVGNGDSTTIVVDAKTIVQLDINHLESADDDDAPRIPILDRLLDELPKVGGKPYLAGFGLTHGDADHCRGFAELNRRALIGDLWFGPRLLWEQKELS